MYPEQWGAHMTQRDSERIENLSHDETGTIIDLSTSGIALLLSSPKEEGREMSLLINGIQAKVKVIYSIPRDEMFRIGLQFMRGSPDVQAMLPELVDKFSKGIPIICGLEDSKVKV